MDAEPTYSPYTGADEDPTDRGGIFDLENPENPVADYSMVYISTCNGDVYLGDSETVYEVARPDSTSDTVTIQHRGYRNAMAALNWVFDAVVDPDVVFIVGWSAGAIPSPIYTSIVADQYPNARIAHLGDSAGGYWVGEKLAPLFEAWGTLDVLAEVGGYEEFTAETLKFEDFYVVESRRHPEIIFHQYNTVEDRVAYSFLDIMGISDRPLSNLRAEAHAYIRARTDNFRAFTAGGHQHDIVGGHYDEVLPEGDEDPTQPYRLDRFYTYQVNGIRFRDWFAAIEAGESVENVQCTECEMPEYASHLIRGKR